MERTSSTEPAGFVLLTGAASVDLWFREILVPQVWRVHLVTGFDFSDKNPAC